MTRNLVSLLKDFICLSEKQDEIFSKRYGILLKVLEKHGFRSKNEDLQVEKCKEKNYL